MQKTWFISDLHLDASRPQMIQEFLEFLSALQNQAEALYILGDLFEYWIGDDILEQAEHEFWPIIIKLQQLSDRGVKLYFVAGNRDFLLGDEFANMTRCKIINQSESVIDIYGTKTLIMHGDTLCTDDVEYLKFRKLLRSQAWKDNFLSKSISDRIKHALKLRNTSKQQTQQKNETILDVNQTAVIDAMQHHQVQQLIHGHTHRMATHRFSIKGQLVKRFVLGDWHDKAHFLSISSNSCTMV